MRTRIKFQIPAELDIEFDVRFAEETTRYDEQAEEVITKSIPIQEVKEIILDYLYQNQKELESALSDRGSTCLTIGADDLESSKVIGAKYIEISLYGWNLNLPKKEDNKNV
jgi:hypothetical protein